MLDDSVQLITAIEEIEKCERLINRIRQWATASPLHQTAEMKDKRKAIAVKAIRELKAKRGRALGALERLALCGSRDNTRNK